MGGGVGQLAQLQQRVVAQLVESAPARLVGRDLDGLQPVAVQVGEEIILRTHAGVDVLGVDAGGGRFGGAGQGGRQAQGDAADQKSFHALSLVRISFRI